MSEEQESTGKSMKNVIIGFISTITLGVGGWITTKLTGGKEEEKPAAVPVININNNNNQNQSAGKTVIVKEKSAEPKPAEPAKPAYVTLVTETAPVVP